MTAPMSPTGEQLRKKVRASVEAFTAMPPVDQAILRVQQKASFVRGNISADVEWTEAHQQALDNDPAVVLMNAFIDARARLREMEGMQEEAKNALEYALGCDVGEACEYKIQSTLYRMSILSPTQPAESGAKVGAASEKCVRISDGVELLTEAFNVLGNLLFDKPGAQDLTLHDRIGKLLHARIDAQRPIREEVMRLMRKDFDPTPPNWEGRDWDDNAEEVADKIMALFPKIAPAIPPVSQEPGDEETARKIAADNGFSLTGPAVEDILAALRAARASERQRPPK